MNKYKLIFTDLDGTLLLPDLMSVSEENLKALEELHRLGIEVVPCSGRTLDQIPKVLTENQNIRYVATSNATVVYDRVTGKTVLDRRLNAEERGLLIDILSDYDLFPCFHINGKGYVERRLCSPEFYKKYTVNEYFSYFFEKYTAHVDGLMQMARQTPGLEMSCCFFGDSEQMAEAKSRLEATGLFRVAKSESRNIEAFSIKGGKGNAVRDLSEKLGVDISETIAVGDSNNDATMVGAAGLGLAVDNAIPELKNIADEVICNFKEHSLDYILKRYIL